MAKPKRQHYTKVIGQLLERALNFDLLDSPAFRTDPPPAYNALESLIVRYFLVSLACLGLEKPRHKAKAMDCLSGLFRKELQKMYPDLQLISTILPQVEARLAEYGQAMLRGEDPGDKLKRLGLAMVANVLVHPPTATEELVGAFIWYPSLATYSSRQLAQLERDKAIRWGLF